MNVGVEFTSPALTLREVRDDPLLMLPRVVAASTLGHVEAKRFSVVMNIGFGCPSPECYTVLRRKDLVVHRP